MRALIAMVRALTGKAGGGAGAHHEARGLTHKLETMFARWLGERVARQLGVDPDIIIVSLAETRRGYYYDVRWRDAPAIDAADDAARSQGGGRWTLSEVMLYGRVLRDMHRARPPLRFNRLAQMVRRFCRHARVRAISHEARAFARPAAGACRMAFAPP